VNSNHAKLCGSAEWAEHIQQDVLPFLTAGLDLGAEMLEVGPGPGAATDWLRHRVPHLVALEADRAAARKLAARLAGSNVEVAVGNATAMRYAEESFDSVGMFTMLHHVPTRAEQDKIFAETFRVLRPGGVLIGSDSLASNDLHSFHVRDTYNPVEPSALLVRLQTVGFAKITLVVDWMLKFIAQKELPGQDGAA
jgi:ubiquinone/menaquinone biosynthesis C-methylase UbiE